MERTRVCLHLACLLATLSRGYASPGDISSVLVTEPELKCHPVLTANVTGELRNGVLRAFGYEFSDGYYQRINYTHFRVCICKVTKCLRKCCLEGQVLFNRSCIDGYDYPVYPRVYDKNLNPIYNYDYTRFVSVYGNTCTKGWFQLEPEIAIQDTYYFLESGILYLPYDEEANKYETEQFCFEHILRTRDEGPGTQTLKTLICFPEEQEKPLPLLPIGMIISTPFLLATFLVYSLPELRNLHGKNLMSHVGSLFVAYVALVIAQMAGTALPFNACIACGYILHYSFLASFFWLNVMCFDIWWAFSGFSSLKGERKSTEQKKYLMYSAYAWGCPAVLSIVTIVMQFAPNIPGKFLKPDIGDPRCFFTNEKAKLAYFYGPTAVILLCDVVFFILTAVKIITVKKETVAVFRGNDSGRNRNREASKQRYNLYLKLFLIMGVNWIMEIISWAAKGPKWVWYFTDFANTLQGLVVFITFVWTRRIRRLVMTKFCPRMLPKEPDTMTSSTKLSRNSSAASGFINNVDVPMNSIPSRKISS